jgi:hypothetical protein
MMANTTAHAMATSTAANSGSPWIVAIAKP